MWMSVFFGHSESTLPKSPSGKLTDYAVVGSIAMLHFPFPSYQWSYLWIPSWGSISERIPEPNANWALPPHTCRYCMCVHQGTQTHILYKHLRTRTHTRTHMHPCCGMKCKCSLRRFCMPYTFYQCITWSPLIHTKKEERHFHQWVAGWGHCGYFLQLYVYDTKVRFRIWWRLALGFFINSHVRSARVCCLLTGCDCPSDVGDLWMLLSFSPSLQSFC